jgi:hypothetical protein
MTQESQKNSLLKRALLKIYKKTVYTWREQYWIFEFTKKTQNTKVRIISNNHL